MSENSRNISDILANCSKRGEKSSDYLPILHCFSAVHYLPLSIIYCCFLVNF